MLQVEDAANARGETIASGSATPSSSTRSRFGEAAYYTQARFRGCGLAEPSSIPRSIERRRSTATEQEKSQQLGARAAEAERDRRPPLAGEPSGRTVSPEVAGSSLRSRSRARCGLADDRRTCTNAIPARGGPRVGRPEVFRRRSGGPGMTWLRATCCVMKASEPQRATAVCLGEEKPRLSLKGPSAAHGANDQGSGRDANC